MSVESAKAFYTRMTTDEAFQLQHQTAASDEARRQIVQAAGYDFTSEEWETAVQEMQGSLSDQELESVSGGTTLPEDHAGKFLVPFPIKPPVAFPMYGISLPLD